MKKIYILISVYLILITVSCVDFISKFENYVVGLNFEGSNYTITKGDVAALTLNATPSDSFLYYKPEFSVSDESICGIIDSEGNQVFIKGYEKGAVILTAKLSNQSTKCVVKVIEEK